jgi:hypothetical protein
MANRMFNRLQALDKEIKILQGQFTVAGSGAPTLVVNKSVGFKSVTKTGVGDYAITLGTPNGDSDIYPHFYNAFITCQHANVFTSTEGGVGSMIKSSAVNSTGVLNVFILAADGSAKEVPADTTVHVTLVLKNSNVAGVGAGSV